LNAPSTSPSASPSKAPTSSPVAGFATVVNGYCRDASGNMYSSASAAFSNASDGVCLNRCNQNKINRFVGVTIEEWSTEKRCYCLFSGGIPKSIKSNTDIYQPAWDVATTEPGIGEVQTSNGKKDFVCYKTFLIVKQKVEGVTGTDGYFVIEEWEEYRKSVNIKN
jgi:hypothetical protein